MLVYLPNFIKGFLHQNYLQLWLDSLSLSLTPKKYDTLVGQYGLFSLFVTVSCVSAD